MKKDNNNTRAVPILHKRYIAGKVERQASLEAERVNAEIARTICDLRKEAGLTQKELAELIGTTQSVISRLEDADYEGHSLSMLSKIAKSLNKRLTVKMDANDPEVETIRFVFREVVRSLRRKKGLTVDQIAKKLDIDRDEIVAMERSNSYRPSPLTLFKLSKFYGVSQMKLAELAGAVSKVDDELRDRVSRFAAQSDSFAKLTSEEKRILDDFVIFLRDKE
jgi:transcriptional regulator with XRE-family HTH domain